MTYDLIQIFIQVAEAGSFSRVAEKRFVSPPAIMQRLNRLETQIGVRLLERSNRGVILTRAGESFYKDVKSMIDIYEKAVSRARQLANTGSFTIGVGDSLLYPCKVLTDLWSIISCEYPKFKMQIVPYKDSQTIEGYVNAVGNEFDLLIGAFGGAIWEKSFQLLKLGEYRFCIAASKEHPLAAKETLTMDDFYGERFVMMKIGISPQTDEIRALLSYENYGIQIMDLSGLYTAEVFNRCEQEGVLILTLDSWQHVHPSLKTLPVDWGYTIPYGLIYSLDPSDAVKQFINVVKSHKLDI